MDIVSRKCRIFRLTFFSRILYIESDDVNRGSEVLGSEVQRADDRSWNSEVGKKQGGKVLIADIDIGNGKSGSWQTV
jgi:hypothetical protein